MKVAVFNTKTYDEEYLGRANMRDGQSQHEIEFLKPHLQEKTAVLAKGAEAVCCFVNDHLDRPVLQILAEQGTRLIVMRCSGFNNIDLKAAHELGIRILRVPAYSPYAVAEHAMALMFSLCRHLPRAHNRVRDGNFSLKGLMGFDIHGKTIGIIGMGAIGKVLCQMFSGFGSDVLGYDPYPNEEFKPEYFSYVGLEDVMQKSDIIFLNCPLTEDTHHLVNTETIAQMKDHVMIINTSRGGLIDTPAVIEGLKEGKIGALGIDVYEEEGDLFFEDLSDNIIKDDVFMRLLTFRNVQVTGHQAFFTHEAMNKITQTTIQNLTDFEAGQVNTANEVIYKN